MTNAFRTKSLSHVDRRQPAQGSREATFASRDASMLPLIKRLETTEGPAEVLTFAGEELKRIDHSHRAAAMGPTVQIYAVALYLRESADAWIRFCQEDRWATFRGKRPSPETAESALRFAFRFAYGFDDPAATKRASKDARMLESAFLRRLTPREVTQEVEEAGGKEAYSQAQQRARAYGEPIGLDPLIKLVPGKRTDRLLATASGGQVRLLIKVQRIEGKTMFAKALKVSRLKSPS